MKIRSGAVLLLGVLLVTAACSTPPAKTEVKPSQSPLQVMAHNAELLVDQGEKLFVDREYSSGREKMDEAMELFLQAPEEWKGRQEYRQLLNRLTARVADLEEGVDDGNDPELLISDNSLIKLSPNESRSLMGKVEKEIKAIHSSIPIELNENVTNALSAYTTRFRDSVSRGLERCGKYLPMIRSVMAENGLPEDLAVLPLLESNYITRATSRASARGLWQFMKGTALLYDLDVNWWLDERCDPEKATQAAAQHLKHLYAKFNDWYLVLAAYDAGEGKIERTLQKINGTTFWDLSKSQYLKRETMNYVPAFLALLIIFKDPANFGFQPPSEAPWEYKRVEIPAPVDLSLVAQHLDVSPEEVQDFNPELVHSMTPYYLKSYSLKVPASASDEVLERLKTLPVTKRVALRHHTVKRGETISRIARKYGTSVYSLQSLNKISSRKLKKGEVLLIPAREERGVTRAPTEKRLASTKVKRSTKGGKKGAAKPVVYKVKSGDNLFSISRRYRVTVEQIQAWNNLKNNRIRRGDNLLIYL